MADDEFEGSPKNWPPLGMPTGSVRAILVLIVVAVVITKLARGDKFNFESEHDLLWLMALVVSLTHYFASRRFVAMSPQLRNQLEEDGVLDKERHPLFLPRNSIRVIIIGAFSWLTYYLYQQDRLRENHFASLLMMMGAFLLGTIVRTIDNWWHHRKVRTSAGTLADLKALLVMAALLIIAVPEFLDTNAVFPAEFHRVALGLMFFYFGSR